jgi:hypothetical protein
MREPSVAFCWLLTALVISWLSGCGSDAPQYKAEDHALTIKTEALNFAATARQGQGQGSIEGFLETVRAYEAGPVGEHGETYAQLVQATEALKGLYESSGSRAQIQEQIEKIASLAGQLPGEVEIEDESGGFEPGTPD